jgi:hypothetical protein
MVEDAQAAAHAFHAGELAMQERTAVREEASRYIGTLGRSQVDGRLGASAGEHSQPSVLAVTR